MYLAFGGVLQRSQGPLLQNTIATTCWVKLAKPSPLSLDNVLISCILFQLSLQTEKAEHRKGSSLFSIATKLWPVGVLKYLEWEIISASVSAGAWMQVQ